MGMKNQLSKISVNLPLGFIYWLNETNDLRGLKNARIEEYLHKLNELQREYNTKYPNGLTGWSEDNQYF